jgi:hypothetical protein
MTEMTEGERLVRIETIVESLDGKFDKFLEAHEGLEKRTRRLEYSVICLATATGLLGFDWLREAFATFGG